MHDHPDCYPQILSTTIPTSTTRAAKLLDGFEKELENSGGLVVGGPEQEITYCMVMSVNNPMDHKTPKDQFMVAIKMPEGLCKAIHTTKAQSYTLTLDSHSQTSQKSYVMSQRVAVDAYDPGKLGE
ncbi:uncharacterized protein STEHIDRAFT_161517 [Stereum hirsutum FP-91666 SS1]|uniref:uncharacterized protein n=1 Tax=Stereum hirsutum (strain FP-91666) TaxID=721885 RepID=UPI0004449A6F|nr:uncharacterized protein STEHIDRAFT_161517 [Stereum hirsutum FP-91666 SS1]EIM82172.1 hypothetical protein STEHIDRAFT_161517 [Stereum hirsutum FP-91666 SS1]